ncbi:MAG TPA: TIM barrel protein [Spirochaetia bacterium]|nr:TIM barrel protein [Spirochaetia bacterium]
MTVHLGVKSDPIEGRYTFDWLFGIMADFKVSRLQMGSFFPTFTADDRWFRDLRARAEKKGIRIASVFTSHREFVGFASGDPFLEASTRWGWERLIHIAALLGADSAGSNAWILLRDQPELRQAGLACFFHHMKDLMRLARQKGLRTITIEPMSSPWEYPSTPEQLASMTSTLDLVHSAEPDATVPVWLCGDISHGVADESKRVLYDNWEMFEREIPWMWEFHFKNTDSIFNSTFGFSPEERARGIVDIGRLRELLTRNAQRFPTDDVTGYLELPGPKLGRDYTDSLLRGQLEESLSALREEFKE